MSPFTRAQLPSTVLPTAVPTAPQQPGTFAQLLGYSSLAHDAHTPRNTVAFAQTDGSTLRLPLSDVQTLIDTSGDHYLVGSFCIKIHKDHITGPAPLWAYLVPPSGATIASGGYVL
jgi:hypothetical protein